MQRNRTKYSKSAITKMQRMMRAGATAAQIAKALAGDGVKASSATVGRWMREQRGARRATKLRSAPPPAPAPPPVAEAIAESATGEGETDIQRLNRLLSRAERHLSVAEAEKNTAAVSAMVRVQRDLLKEIRRAMREQKPDPNDAPDMVAAAMRARERLHKYVDYFGPKADASATNG